MHQSTAAAPILSFKLTLRHKRFFLDGKFSYLVPHGWPKVGARKRTDAPLPALSAINSAAVSAPYIACENSRFSTLLAAGDVSRGGMSATQRQKFLTDEINQCLHNKSGSHGIPNTNLLNLTFLPVGFGKVFCSSANEL